MIEAAIRSFLTSARDLWGIRWAVLGGDHETIPLRMVHVTYAEPMDIPSDAYYAIIAGGRDNQIQSNSWSAAIGPRRCSAVCWR